MVFEATEALGHWLSSNHLRLNSDISQFLWLGGRTQLATVDMEFPNSSFTDTHYSSSVRDNRSSCFIYKPCQSYVWNMPLPSSSTPHHTWLAIPSHGHHPRLCADLSILVSLQKPFWTSVNSLSALLMVSRGLLTCLPSFVTFFTGFPNPSASSSKFQLSSATVWSGKLVHTSIPSVPPWSLHSSLGPQRPAGCSPPARG